MRTEPMALFQATRAGFAAVATTPHAARSFIRVTLRAWDLEPLIERAELIASELVTNAVAAMQRGAPHPDRLADLPPIGVELRLDDGVFRIAVQDGSPGQPALQAVGDDAEHGRGLLLVDLLSARWDVVFVQSGKVTWAELDTVAAGGA